MFQKFVGETAEKLANSYAAIKFYQSKMYDITKRQKAFFQVALFFAQSVKMTVESLINGPLIGLIKFFPIFGVILLILIFVF